MSEAATYPAKQGKLAQIRRTLKYDTSAFRVPRQTDCHMFIANAKCGKMEQIVADGTVYTPFLLLLRKIDFTFIEYYYQQSGGVVMNIRPSAAIRQNYN